MTVLILALLLVITLSFPESRETLLGFLSLAFYLGFWVVIYGAFGLFVVSAAAFG